MVMVQSLICVRMGKRNAIAYEPNSVLAEHIVGSFGSALVVFDPSGGVLSLRRPTIEQRPREFGILFSSPDCISLPQGWCYWSSALPPSRANAARKRPGLMQ